MRQRLSSASGARRCGSCVRDGKLDVWRVGVGGAMLSCACIVVTALAKRVPGLHSKGAPGRTAAQTRALPR